MITAILMASGFSRRFQTDKLMLDFHGKPVLARTMAAILACPFEERLLITQSRAHTELAKDYDFVSHMNQQAVIGQTASIQLGVSHAPKDSAYMFFVGDQPCLTPAVINRLIAEHELYPDMIIVPTVNGNHKNPVIFPASFRDELLSLTGDTGGRKVITAHPECLREITFIDGLPFTDMDTPNEYQRLLSK